MRRVALAGSLSVLIAGAPLATIDERSASEAVPRSGPSVPSRLANPGRVRERLGLSPDYDAVPAAEGIKVAILDYGFEGAGAGRGYLPEGAEVVEHYDPEFVRRFGLGDPEYRKGFEPGNRHGREMAQIVWSVAGSSPRGPKFYLLNANGPTMLRRAIRFAIEHDVDLVLFSGSFEGGGNGDGQGPVDRAVSEAVDRGILWVNAAGNYGHKVYNGPVRVLKDGYLRLRDGSDVASLRLRNRLDENEVTVTLTWNDYREDEDAGTTKDLDLFVEDWAGRVVASGDKAQVPGSRTPGPTETRNPRERVVLANLAANPVVANDPDYGYRIRVRAKGGRFDAKDRIRILVTAAKETYLTANGDLAEAVKLVDATEGGEVYPPADHPGVLAVGDAGVGSSVGPTLDGRAKPDVTLEDSRANFTDGQWTGGSSNAAAYFAGIVAVLKAAEPGLRRDHLVRLAAEGSLLTPQQTVAQSSTPPPRPRPPTRVWKTPTRRRLAEVVRGLR